MFEMEWKCNTRVRVQSWSAFSRETRCSSMPYTLLKFTGPPFIQRRTVGLSCSMFSLSYPHAVFDGFIVAKQGKWVLMGNYTINKTHLYPTMNQIWDLGKQFNKYFKDMNLESFQFHFCFAVPPGSNFFGKTPLFFRYSGVNAANAVNLQAKRR